MAPKDVSKGKWSVDVEVTGQCGGAAVHWHVPEEAPVALVYGGINHVVMLASPADLQDFALGFTVTEGIARSPEDIRKIEVVEKDRGIDLLVTLDDTALERFKLKQGRRAMTGRTGCGLCGIDSMEQLFQKVRPVAIAPVQLDPQVAGKAVDDFCARQPMKELNKSVHGAAWVTGAGDITAVREDVGRHNALDKLIGALLKEDADLKAGFVLISSRASYEMVQKCVAVGVPALVCLSAPTAFAIRMAHEANLTLANWSRDGLVTF